MSDFKQKYKERIKKRNEEASTVRKIVAVVLTTIVIVLLIGGISGYFYVNHALQPVDPDDETQKNIEIPLGSSNSQIAKILEENQVINNALIFRFYTKFKNETGFQAGEYQFTSAMTLDEIVASLKTGKVRKDPVFSVTIPEGYTLEQIAASYAKKLDFTKEEFMKKVNDSKYVSQLIEQHPALLDEVILKQEIRYPLEGYLFASTYNFYIEDPSIEQIVNKMIKRTEEVVLPYRDALNKLNSDEGMTIHQVITMASLLENEAKTKENRRKIAGVFYNRIEKGMKLQTDPTVLYALGEHKDRVLYKDLEVESPYNTYHVKKLPVGPISSFHKNSMAAAANPIESDYLYFLADGDGNIYYSKTLEKHNKLKAEHISGE
ncbi:endolytic transglycosylase MltG [Halobacillus shinanisalinarum]|uniref:Endolytic murein transglycosylase n=1 Tax=Halobacillus shinanisalinarum TaxID=2932258 RepID=A0ABY4H051_9BACI|nr:endolytic transglycosylase MltG [Halobacillus shinanisalinarum]UOQ93822.1 endolytic transglycosylase MltG [Halobacillus shinanisalinarum]